VRKGIAVKENWINLKRNHELGPFRRRDVTEESRGTSTWGVKRNNIKGGKKRFPQEP